MMFLAILAAVFALTALAALGICAWMLVRLFGSVHLAAQVGVVAAQLNDAINARVKARVRAINAPPLGSDDVPESPADVRVKQATMLDELHEISRELKRPRSRTYDYDKRDLPENALLDAEPPIVEV